MKLSPAILTAALKGVKQLPAGRISDGRNLYLSVNDKGAMSWVFMWKTGGKRTELGLGSFTGTGTTFRLTLAEARLKADQVRAQIAAGLDPLANRKQAKREAAATFRFYMDAVIETRRNSWKASNRDAQARVWRSSLETHAKAIVDMAPADIGFDDVVKVLKPIWNKIPKTADEVRNRIEIILDRAGDDGVRSGANPAKWEGKLARTLGEKRKDSDAVQHAALDHSHVPAFVSRLQDMPGMHPKAMVFAILNANRASEARCVKWEEVDLDRALWTIPGDRMKAGAEHVIPLSAQAVELLRSIDKIAGNPFVFAGKKEGQSIGASAFTDKLEEMKVTGITMHGFRAAFRTWASKKRFNDKAAEMALAHKVGSKVTRAYDRDDLIEQRTEILQAWADHCFGKSNVVTLRRWRDVHLLHPMLGRKAEAPEDRACEGQDRHRRAEDRRHDGPEGLPQPLSLKPPAAWRHNGQGREVGAMTQLFEHIEKVKQLHARAYEKWTHEEDADLLSVIATTEMPLAQLAAHFQRQPSAIRSRLEKLSSRAERDAAVARADAAEKRLSALEHALHGVGFRVTYVTTPNADNIAVSIDALETKP